MYVCVIHKNIDEYIRIQNSEFFEKSVFFCIHLYSFVCYNIDVDLNNTYFGGIDYDCYYQKRKRNRNCKRFRL